MARSVTERETWRRRRSMRGRGRWFDACSFALAPSAEASFRRSLRAPKVTTTGATAEVRSRKACVQARSGPRSPIIPKDVTPSRPALGAGQLQLPSGSKPSPPEP